MMNYKGYLGLLRIDEEEGILRGKVVNTRDTITFQGTTVAEAMQAFHDSVKDYLEFCEELGRPPEKPFSGKFVVRVGPEIHRKLSVIAQTKGTSVNKLVKRQILKLVRRAEGRLALSGPAIPTTQAGPVKVARKCASKKKSGAPAEAKKAKWISK